MDLERNRREADLCKKAANPWPDELEEDLIAILRSGYPLHQDWGVKAADTIERLQERIEAIERSPGAAAALRQITRIMKERDAALDEIERLKAALKTVAGVDQRQRAARMEGE